MHATATLRVVETNALAYRRVWRGSVFTTIVSPVLYLAAMGLGLGSIVDEGGAGATLAGESYLDFLAPGLLAAAAMQTAAGEASWPVFAGFKWQPRYFAMLATPLGPGDIAVGQLVWIGVRVAITAGVFTVVMAVFGAVTSPWVVLAIPAAVLCGVAFAAAVAAYTASLQREYGLPNLFRFGIVPMFLFSGAFFPVEQLPDAVEWLAYVVPLWHGVELCRGLSLGTLDPGAAVAHVAYLVAWTAAGTAATVARFRKRLVV
ncbi:MAG: ABC transporter permease [Acidimicrobiales bacterium]